MAKNVFFLFGSKHGLVLDGHILSVKPYVSYLYLVEIQEAFKALRKVNHRFLVRKAKLIKKKKKGRLRLMDDSLVLCCFYYLIC